MILLILNTLAPNLVQKKYVKMTGYLYKKRPRRAASYTDQLCCSSYSAPQIFQ